MTVRIIRPSLQLIGSHAVPVWGFSQLSWPQETVFIAYAAESIVVALGLGARLRFMAPARVPTAYGTRARDEPIFGFLLITIGFPLVGGLIGTMIVVEKVDVPLTLEALQVTLAASIAIQIAILVVDYIRRSSLAAASEVDRWVILGVRRGCVMHGSVFIGILFYAFSAEWFLYGFIGLRMFFDIGTAVEEIRLRTGRALNTSGQSL